MRLYRPRQKAQQQRLSCELGCVSKWGEMGGILQKTTKPDKQTLKTYLLARFEQELDRALSRLDDDTPIDLDEIEQITLQARGWGKN